MPIEFNELETRRFGIRCAKIVRDQAPLAEINMAAHDQGIQFLSVRVSTNHIARTQEFEVDGFRIMDTLVYYHLDLTSLIDPPTADAEIAIRHAQKSDANSVAELAGKAFAGYFGHYHADRRLSREEADAVYVDWAKSSVLLADPIRPVLVAISEGSLSGFLTANVKEGEIALNAVHPDWQRRGIYSALLEHTLKIFQASGCLGAIISTQINNVPVQRVWAKRGFRLQESFYTLHKWLD